jgi:hypothetical protein
MIRRKQVTKYFKRRGLKKIRENNTRKISKVSFQSCGLKKYCKMKCFYSIASKSNHSNTMLPNVMVLASLQKLKIKYELSYQSTTRLKYIDKGVGMIRAD